MGGYPPGQASAAAGAAGSDITFLSWGKVMGIRMCESSYTVHKVLSPGYAFLGVRPVGALGLTSGLMCIGL